MQVFAVVYQHLFSHTGTAVWDSASLLYGKDFVSLVLLTVKLEKGRLLGTSNIYFLCLTATECVGGGE